MFDILAQNGIELTIGSGTVGLVLGFVGKHLITKKKNGFQTKEICGIMHGHIKDDLNEIKDMLKDMRRKG